MIQERTFKQTSTVEQIAIHFALDGNMLHKDSDEARRQQARNFLEDGKQLDDLFLLFFKVANQLMRKLQLKIT